MAGVLGNLISLCLHVCLLVSFSIAVKYQYQCTCTCQPEEQCHMQLSETVVFNESISTYCEDIDYCPRSGSYETDDCQSFQKCCWLDDDTLQCERGPEYKCKLHGKNCTAPRASDCKCTHVQDEEDSSEDDSQEEDRYKERSGDRNIFGIGIGVGVGLSVLIAALFALLVYCRIQGRKEGRRESQQNIISSRKSKGESEIYSEIDENVIQGGGRSTHAAVNPGYNTSDEVIGPTKNNVYLGLNKEDATTINHQYKSLKKPNQDLGSGDYADPEKYTEPPVLPYRNSNAIDNEYVCDEEDYVSQGTPEPARNDEGDDDEEEDIDDYVDHGTSSSIRVKMESDSPSEELTSASEPFSQEPGAIVAKASDQEHNNSDYITGVDNIADPNVDPEEVIEQVESDYIDM